MRFQPNHGTRRLICLVAVFVYCLVCLDPPLSCILPRSLQESALEILPGELPGESGWPRPKATKSPMYHTTQVSAKVAKVKEDWKVQVKCEACQQDHAYFYARAYGPAVLSGNVERISDGVYEVAFRFLDAGLYTVELIMEYSNLPDFGSFPLQNGMEEPGYEGFSLPGFPMHLQVNDSLKDSKVDEQRKCTRMDLTGRKPSARWKVVKKTDKPNKHWLNGRQARSLLGIYMDYEFENCRLLQEDDLSAKLGVLVKKRQELGLPVLRFLFVGDSVMRLQFLEFLSLLPDLKRVDQYYYTAPGMEARLVSTFGGLAALTERNILYPSLEPFKDSQHENVILFNSGLHDLHGLCTREKAAARTIYLPLEKRQFSCVKMYQDLMSTFAQYMESYPSLLAAFQTSNAAWPIHGMVGVSWVNNTTPHPFPKSPHMVSRFNDVAIRSLNHTTPVLDNFYLSLSRPDNREVNKRNELGGKMVHPGPEIVKVDVRIWATMLIERLDEEVVAATTASKRQPTKIS